MGILSKNKRTSLILIILFILNIISVFLFKDFSFYMNSFNLILLTIALLSKNKYINLLGVSSYLIFLIKELANLAYIGFDIYSLLSFLLILIYYLYPKEKIFSKNQGQNENFYFNRLGNLIKIGFISIILYSLGSSITYFIGNEFEKIFQILTLSFVQFFLVQSKNKISINENKELSFLYVIKKTFIPLLLIWIIILDIAIIKNLFLPPKSFLYFVDLSSIIFTILINIFISNLTLNEDLSFVHKIYKYLTILQPILLLLLMEIHKPLPKGLINFRLIYGVIFLIIYLVFFLNKINIKTFLILISLLYFTPFLGYISNPYQLSSSQKTTEVISIITRKEDFLISLPNLNPEPEHEYKEIKNNNIESFYVFGQNEPDNNIPFNITFKLENINLIINEKEKFIINSSSVEKPIKYKDFLIYIDSARFKNKELESLNGYIIKK